MIGLYAGSFDPWTNGHEDVLQQAIPLFSRIYILVCDNPKKKHMFSLDKRISMLDKHIETFENKNDIYVVEMHDFKSTVRVAENCGAEYLIRGIRSVSDFEYELQVASMNKRLNKDIHTMYFTPSVNNQFTSSTMVREFIAIKEDYSELVPKAIVDYIERK